MLSLLGVTAIISLAVMLFQRKARRWSRLIGQGADKVSCGLGDQAEQCLRGALAITKTARGPLWLGRRLSTMLPLAHLLLNHGRYQEAADVAVEYVEEVRRRAVDSDLIARGLSLLGDISAARGNLTEAEALYRATLEMEERMMGEHSIELAPSLVKLAAILQSQSRQGEATVLFRRCSELIGS